VKERDLGAEPQRRERIRVSTDATDASVEAFYFDLIGAQNGTPRRCLPEIKPSTLNWSTTPAA